MKKSGKLAWKLSKNNQKKELACDIKRSLSSHADKSFVLKICVIVDAVKLMVM